MIGASHSILIRVGGSRARARVGINMRSLAVLALPLTSLTLTKLPPLRLAAPHEHRGRPIVCSGAGTPPPVDKQMSNPDELVTFAETNEDFKELMLAALVRLDRNRVLQGKPKYETVDGMIDAYVEEAAGAGLGWTRADAESEVVRYLKRQALADEGGESAPDNVFIGIFAVIVIYAAVTGIAPAQDLPAAVVSPY